MSNNPLSLVDPFGLYFGYSGQGPWLVTHVCRAILLVAVALLRPALIVVTFAKHGAGTAPLLQILDACPTQNSPLSAAVPPITM